MDPIIQIGEQAPNFQLKDLNEQTHSLEELRGWIAILNFWSAECTWCERVDHELIKFLHAWNDIARVLWIASNASETPDFIGRVAGDREIAPVLLDPHQQVADMYGAQTTPHFFVIDKAGKLAYQGAWDDISFRQRTATQVYVPMVLESLASYHAPTITSTPPYGCALVRSFAGDR